MPSSQQITAASNIATLFAAKKIRYALLKAECQAGKTGAFHELIRRMFAAGEIERAYILCGSSETELRDQAKKDAQHENAGKPITVLFRQDFKGVTMEINNTLIVVDESHMDAEIGMQMDQFLGRHGLSMDGNPKALNAKNAYLLSVSATPYAEICAMEHKETPFDKHVETLISGDGYFGLSQYMYGGLLKPTFDVVEDSNAFEALFAGTPKYALIRLSHGKHCRKQEVAIAAICKKKGYVFTQFTEKKNDITIDDLNCAPSVPTVVIIRQRLRAGKVVCKKHVSFVWEGAESSDTAALVQGLPGRMCGYEFGETKPLIFVPPPALMDYEKKVVKASELERAAMCPTLMPRKSKFLVPGAVPSRPKNGKTQCPPIRLVDEGDDDEWRFTDDLKAMPFADIRKHCYDLLMKNISAIESAPFSAEQKAEIINEIVLRGAEKAHVRRCGDFSQRAYYTALLEAHGAGATVAEQVGDCGFLNFITWTGSKLPGANKRHVYVVFYTDASAGLPGVLQTPLTARIPRTNGKSQFSVHDGDFKEPLVAGGVVGFNESNIKTPATFEKALHDYLTLFKSSELMVARKIESAKSRFQLSKRAFAYKDTKSNKVEEVCERLGAEFGLKLVVKYARASSSAYGHFNVKTITW